MRTSAADHASDRNNSVLINGGKRVQAKLQVNEPGDVYEQEADAMADSVMRMNDSNTGSSTQPITGLIGKSVQRKCAHCEEEEKKKVMRKTDGSSGGRGVSSSFASSLQTSRAGGAALPAATRGKMENAFGADFSDVKIHTDSKAAEMSRGINARAFTYGSDIYFNRGEYGTDTERGQKLLAHELTHVVQQGNGISTSIQRDFALDVPNPDFVARELTEVEMREAIRFNQMTLVTLGRATPEFIGQLRDILGVSEDPPVIDEEFVNAVVRWQAQQNLVQDGKLGRDSAAPLFSEIQAESLGDDAINLARIYSTGVLTPRQNFSGRSQVRFGVGEIIDLTLRTLTTTSAATFGGVQWVLVSGGGTLASAAANDGTGTYTAGDVAAAVVLQLRVASGALIGTVLSTHNINIVPPNAVHMDNVGGVVKHSQNFPDSGILTDVFLLPDNVSFSRVTYRELDVVGVPTNPGAYSCNTFSGGHCAPAGLGPCGDKTLTTTVVSGKGTKSTLGDCAYSGHCGGTAPFVAGSISLAIPYEYKVGAGAFHNFATVAQVHTLAADASTLTTSKAGANGTTTVAAANGVIAVCP